MSKDKREANVDQMAWLRNQFMTAMKMAIAMEKQRTVGADENAFMYGLRGIARGCSHEAIRILDMKIPADDGLGPWNVQRRPLARAKKVREAIKAERGTDSPGITSDPDSKEDEG
jgi:hypothetical protein